jgi:hypothetical protein
MADSDKTFTLCWGQLGHTARNPRQTKALGPFGGRLLPFSGSSGRRPWKGVSTAIKTRRGTSSPPKPWPASQRTSTTNRDIVSMAGLLALTDSTPPERCYPNALLNQFDSQSAFGDTKISLEERSRRATTLLAKVAAKRASPS